MGGLTIGVEGGVEVWTLDRPDAANALSGGLVAALGTAIERCRARTVVIAGGERVFCAGADLRERSRMSEDETLAFLRTLGRTLRALELASPIFMAAIDGPALGGGAELALACDLRIAGERATFAFPEVGLGIIPGAGGTQRLPRLVGLGRAKELILSSRRVDAEEALRLGLVERVARGQSAREMAVELAASLAHQAPLALVEAKRAMEEGRGLALDAALEVEERRYARTLGTRDRSEGLSAFAEKRAPRFIGE